jgi:hypothetical protein
MQGILHHLGISPIEVAASNQEMFRIRVGCGTLQTRVL